MLSRPSIPSFVPIIVTAALIYCLYKITVFLPRFLRRRTFKAEHGCQPLLRQFHSKFPVFGLDWIRTNLTATRHKRYLDTMCTRFENIGPTFKIQVLNQKAIATNEPENIKAILSLRFQDFTLRNRSIVMGKLLGKGIFTTDGQDWAHSRAMLRPNFVKEQIGDLDTFESHVQDLFKLIPRDGSTVDLQPLFFRFTLDSATDFLFGHSIHSLRQSEEADQRFGEAFDYALGELALRFRLGPFLIFRRNKKADEAFRTCRAYVDQLVDEALRYRQAHGEANAEKAGAQNLFLHALARETNDKDRIRDELLNILIAGRDSTASLLSHCFFEISRKPTVWQLLKKEVSPLDGKSPTYDQLRNLKYLKFCIQETLRLHPPVPTNTRLCVNDTVLPLGGGRSGEDPVFVSKGTIMVYSVHAMHRRKDFYGPDAAEFRPERWAERRHSWEYLPFNGGPRICLGQQYAMTEASYVLVRALQEYQTIEARDSQPWTESLRLTVCSENGVQVGVT